MNKEKAKALKILGAFLFIVILVPILLVVIFAPSGETMTLTGRLGEGIAGIALSGLILYGAWKQPWKKKR